MDSKITKTDINKAFHFFIKLGLVYTEEDLTGSNILEVKKIALKDFLLQIDQLIIATLMDLPKVCPLELKAKEIKKITLSTISKDNIKN